MPTNGFFCAVLLSLAAYSSAQDCQFNFTHATLVLESEQLEQQAKLAYTSELKAMNESYGGKKLAVLKTNLEERREYFNTMLEEGELIIDGELYDYVRALLDKIVAAMKLPPRNLFLVRDESANAFNIGDNTIFIHLGLILRAQTEEQLVFVMGHELGHNELHHYRERLLDYADLAVNDSIQKRITRIKGSEYGRVSALNNLMIPWILESRSKSRIAEQASDNYGYECLLACGYDPRKAYPIFDIFDHSEREYDTNALDLKSILLLDETGLDFSAELVFRQESSLGVFEEDRDTLEDLLRTHPFGNEREQLFEEKLDNSMLATEMPDNAGNYPRYQALAEREIIIDALYKQRLGRALFYSLYLHRRDASDCFSKMVIPFCFAYLGYEKIKRRSGKHIETQSPYFDDAYNQLIYFLREISPEKCFAIATNWTKHFKDHLGTDIANPTLLILDLKAKNMDNFNIRYQTEMNRPGVYYLKNTFELLKTENEQ